MAVLGCPIGQSQPSQDYVITWVEQPPAGVAPTDLGIHQPPAPPVIDGVINEPAWARAQSVLAQVLTQFPTQGAEPTVVRLAYDDEWLYVAVDCQDSQIEPLAEDFYKNDSISVRIRIGAFGERRSSSFTFRLTPHGLVDARALKASDETLPSDELIDRSRPLDKQHYHAAVTRTQQGCSVEFALAWSALEWRVPTIAEPFEFFVERRNINGAQIQVSDWPYDQPVRFVWGRWPAP